MTEKKINITRITLLEADGAETVINVTEDLHYLFAFTKVPEGGGKGLPLEILVKGTVRVCGELFYRIGENHPDLITFCAMRSIEQNKDEMLSAILRDAPVAGNA
jgi:hypothetical protein